MDIIKERRQGDRRADADRRSGKDSRPPEERQLLGERRLNLDRRSARDRRLAREDPAPRKIFLKLAVAASVLFLADVHYFDGMHSTYVAQTMGRELNSQVTEWLRPAFSGI
jgi:hypothetical protein